MRLVNKDFLFLNVDGLLFSHLDLVIEMFFYTLYRGNGVMSLWPSEKCGLWSLNHVAALPRDARAVLTEQQLTFFFHPPFPEEI